MKRDEQIKDVKREGYKGLQMGIAVHFAWPAHQLFLSVIENLLMYDISKKSTEAHWKQNFLLSIT